VWGFDVVSLLDACARDAGQYQELASELADGTSSSFRVAMHCPPDIPLARARAPSPLPITFGSYDGEHIPLADESLDLVTSNSVLEHVRNSLVPELLRDLFRTLRPGGVMVHAIDLRDHMRILDYIHVRGDWLHSLQYTTREYEAMFSHQPVYINRLRSCQWRAAIESVGFEVVAWNPTSLPLSADFDRTRLQRPWCDYDEQELAIGLIECTARKPRA
jgi:SAM-dependent methyltransferase